MATTTTKLNLGKFPKPIIPGNRGLLIRIIWYLVNASIFQSRLPILPSRAKTALLRVFGAKVDSGVILKPRVTIKCPWFLELGENTWIGEGVWIDNPGKVVIGPNVCISQGTYLVTGDHDCARADFRFFARPITVGERCWIRARAVIPPGSEIPPNTVVPIGSVWRDHSKES